MNDHEWSEDKLKLLRFTMDVIPDAVYWITLEGRIWNVNKAACGMLGYAREELLSLSVHDIDPEYSREDGQSDLEELKRTGVLHLKRCHRTRDGRMVPVEITSNYFIYNDVEYICCTVRDISERVKAEKEADFFRTLVEYTHDPVYVVNHTKGSRLVYVNEAACRGYGREREELVTMRVPDLNPVLDDERIGALHEELKKKKSLRFESVHQVPTGEWVPVEVTATFMELDGEELVVGSFHDISHRKAMEAELRSAREELEKRVEERTAELAETVRELRFTQFAIDRAADQAFWMTENGRFFYVNDAACDSLGYSRDALLGMSVPDINPTCAPEEFPGYWKELREKGSLTFETIHRTKDGREYPVEIRANYVVFDGKEYNCAFATDITERKRAEEELLLSRFCIEKAAIGIFETDSGARILSVNDFACRSLGYSREELLAMSIFDIDPVITREEMRTLRGIVDATGSVTHETVHRRKDGTTLPVEITANFVEFRGELHVVSFAKDITERKRAEDALRASEAEKSLILNSTMDYVMYHDLDMKIVWANWKACELTKLPVEDLIGRHCWAVVHKRDKPCEGCPAILARDTGEPQKMERYSPNGMILNMRAYPIRSEDGRLLGVAEFASDITEQKRAEEALQKAHAELESRVRERTEQLTSLTAELSLVEERERRRIATELHDHVGQTLIMSKIRLDSLSPDMPAGVFETALGEAREQIARALEDIRSLTFQLSPPLLYEVGFEAAVEWLGEEFEEKYGFQVEFQEGGKRKSLDEETGIALYQMVRELLVNVAKHARAKKVGISVEKVAGKIRISVADDGIGFDARNGMRRRKRGFGLFNVRQRIEYMGGKFEIESTVGHGTRIGLLLPLGKNKGEGSRGTRSKGPHKPIPGA